MGRRPAMNNTARIIFEEAKKKHYVVKRGSQRVSSQVYYDWCKEQNLPFVSVRLRREYADLHLDIFPTRRQLSEEAMIEIAELVESYRVPYKKSSLNEHGWDDTGWFLSNRIPIGKAVKLASQVFELAASNLEPVQDR